MDLDFPSVIVGIVLGSFANGWFYGSAILRFGLQKLKERK